jgi:hypothetical protein
MLLHAHERWISVDKLCAAESCGDARGSFSDTTYLRLLSVNSNGTISQAKAEKSGFA